NRQGGPGADRQPVQQGGLMTTPQELANVMNHFNGGSDGRYRHPFNRRFIYTDGVKAVAEEAGAYWLLDIVATEVAPLLLKLGSDGILDVEVDDKSRCVLSVTTEDDKPPVWSRKLDFTT